MPADMNDTLHDVAARPSRDVPLAGIERRLRTRRRQRRGAALACGALLIGGIAGAGVLLTGGSEPSVRTTHAAQSLAAGGVATVDLPDGWVQSPLQGAPNPGTMLVVGTVALGPGQQVGCPPGPDHATDAFVLLYDLAQIGVRNEDAIARPADFASAPHRDSPCTSLASTTTSSSAPAVGRVLSFTFTDGGRVLLADISLGSDAPASREAEAFTVLNSLVVTPTTDVTLQTLLPPVVPTTGEPPSTVPVSDDTKAITAAFETWIASKPPAFNGVDGVIEDWASIKETAKHAADLVGNPQCYTGHVDAITRVGVNDADVIFSFFCDGQPTTPSHAQGRAVKINGVWMVSRDTVCETFAIGEARCPARQ